MLARAAGTASFVRRQGNILVAFVSSAIDRAAVVQGADELRVHFCGDAHQVAMTVSDHRVVAAVLELQDDSCADLGILARAIGRLAMPIPLLLRFELRNGSVRRMLAHYDESADVRFSLRGFDALSQCVAWLVRSTEDETARSAIVSRLAPVARPAVADIVVGAAIVGERRSTVRQLAGLSHVSSRTVDERMAAAHVMPAKKLLMRMLVLHTQWRVSRLGWTPKRAAAAAGFPSADALARRMERSVGLRLSTFCRERSFGEELDRLAVDLGEHSPSLQPVSA